MELKKSAIERLKKLGIKSTTEDDAKKALLKMLKGQGDLKGEDFNSLLNIAEAVLEVGDEPTKKTKKVKIEAGKGGDEDESDEEEDESDEEEEDEDEEEPKEKKSKKKEDDDEEEEDEDEEEEDEDEDEEDEEDDEEDEEDEEDDEEEDDEDEDEEPKKMKSKKKEDEDDEEEDEDEDEEKDDEDEPKKKKSKKKEDDDEEEDDEPKKKKSKKVKKEKKEKVRTPKVKEKKEKVKKIKFNNKDKEHLKLLKPILSLFAEESKYEVKFLKRGFVVNYIMKNAKKPLFKYNRLAIINGTIDGFLSLKGFRGVSQEDVESRLNGIEITRYKAKVCHFMHLPIAKLEKILKSKNIIAMKENLRGVDEKLGKNKIELEKKVLKKSKKTKKSRD